MDIINPTQLSDLFSVFDNAAQGRNTALAEPDECHFDLSVSEIEMGEGRLGITTSGTTGKPKRVWVPWSELVKNASQSDAVRGWHWASPFTPVSFAGVQVALQAWLSGGSITQIGADWEQAWRILNRDRVDALSCTPTYLELLMQNEPETGTTWQPKQITLGGEVVRAGNVQRARGRFPDARVTSIYATTEMGVLMKTCRDDGWYETDALTARFPQWEVENGELKVWRHGKWCGTGDLVEVNQGFIRVTGRADQVANVAGTKVNLGEVSALAEKVRGIKKATATAEPSPVVGQIVCLQYALEDGADDNEVRAELERMFRTHLRKEAWPRKWQVGEIEVGANYKGRVQGKEVWGGP